MKCKEFVKMRKNSGYTKQENLAKILKLDRSTIGKWEAGEAKPRLEMIPILADLFDVSVETIVMAFIGTDI